jgi:hypothetical protein
MFSGSTEEPAPIQGVLGLPFTMEPLNTQEENIYISDALYLVSWLTSCLFLAAELLYHLLK